MLQYEMMCSDKEELEDRLLFCLLFEGYESYSYSEYQEFKKRRAERYEKSQDLDRSNGQRG